MIKVITRRTPWRAPTGEYCSIRPKILRAQKSVQRVHALADVAENEVCAVWENSTAPSREL